MKIPLLPEYLMILLLLSHPCRAQDRLVFSRPEGMTGIAALMGERILDEAYGRLGIEYEFLELPNARALATADSGRVDGEFQRISGLEPDHPNLIMISVPIGEVDIMVFTRDLDFTVQGWGSLAPYSIGFVRGFKLAEIYTGGMDVYMTDTSEQAFLMLNAGRIDLVVDSRSALCRLRDHDLSPVRMLEPPLTRHIVYHYLHISHADLAVRLESVLREMEETGELKIIKERALLDYLESCGE